MPAGVRPGTCAPALTLRACLTAGLCFPLCPALQVWEHRERPLIFCIQNLRPLRVISQGAGRKTFSHPVSTCWSTCLFCLEGKLHSSKTFWSFLTLGLVLMSKACIQDLSLPRDPSFLLLPVSWSPPQTTKLQDNQGILSLNHKSSL